jgi:hypothetical protein
MKKAVCRISIENAPKNTTANKNNKKGGWKQ